MELGISYEGEFKNDKAEGFGIFKSKHYTYTGDFY